MVLSGHPLFKCLYISTRYLSPQLSFHSQPYYLGTQSVPTTTVHRMCKYLGQEVSFDGAEFQYPHAYYVSASVYRHSSSRERGAAAAKEPEDRLHGRQDLYGTKRTSIPVWSLPHTLILFILAFVTVYANKQQT